MGVFSNKISRDDLKPGDHIYSWRNGYLYSHHGIYAGEEKVIHFTRGPGQETGTGTGLDNVNFSSSGSFDHSICQCAVCGDQSNLSGVISSCLDSFLWGGGLYRFEYGVSHAFFVASRGGTCTFANSDPPEDALFRARHLLANGFGVYNVFTNNCEDFAIYCKTGLLVVTNGPVGRSGQATTFVAALDTAVITVVSTAVKSFLPATNLVTAAVCCKYVLGRIANDIGKRRDVMKIPVEELIERTHLSKPTETAIDKPTEAAIGEPTETAIGKPTEAAIAKQMETAIAKQTEAAIVKPIETAVVKEENKYEELSEKEKEKESSNRNNNKRREYSRFPVREDAEDCPFYLKTGVCKFGMNCKFNHPPNHKKFQGAKVKTKEEGVDSGAMKEKDESVDKEQIECKYFDRPGGCKFGKACKYNHIKKANPSNLNFMGLPIRPGEKECRFYMRNGSCKYGANCRFNHPDPTTIGVADALPRYSNGGPIFSPNVSQSTLAPWSPTALNESPPYVPLMFSPTQSVPPQPPEWNAYQAPVYPPERNVHMPPTYAVDKGLLERPEQMQGDEFPERPGQPECSYFLKTGNCKYKSACKFHHPKSAMAQSPSCRLNDMGLPLRPGENVCSHYSRYGICKYGPACKYDHPINYAHSSQLTISADQTPASGSMVNKQTMAAGS